MSFSQLCRPKSRVLSPERKKEIATQLNNEGFNCNDGEKVSVPGVGLNLTKRECYELAISMDPTLAEAFYNLGTVLKAGEEAMLGALALSEGECFRRAVELDGSIAPAWFNLGVCLRPPVSSAAINSIEESPHFFFREDEESGQDVPLVMVSNVEYSKKGCYIRALEIDKKLAYAWFNLGIAVGATDLVFISGKWDPHNIDTKHEGGEEEENSYCDLDCFVSALNIDSTLAAAWAMAGRRLSNIESSDEAFCGKNIKLSNTCGGGDSQEETEEENDNNSNNNNNKKPPKPTIQISGKFYNAHECFVESLKLDPLSSSVWFLAGMSLENDRSIFEIKDKLYDKQGAFETSLQYFEHRSVVWYELGSTLLRKKRQRKGALTSNLCYGYVKGRKVTPLDCFVKSLELDDFNAKAWFNAGVLLENKATVEINNQECSEKICFEKCLALDPSIGLAWFNLATTLKQSSSSGEEAESLVKPKSNSSSTENIGLVGDEEYSQGDCFVLSLSQNPRHRASWFHLGRFLDQEGEGNTSSSGVTSNSIKRSISTEMIQLSSGEFVNSKNCYERCLELDGKDLSAWKRLARTMTSPTTVKSTTAAKSEKKGNAESSFAASSSISSPSAADDHDDENNNNDDDDDNNNYQLDNPAEAIVNGKSLSREDCMKMIVQLSSNSN